MLVVFVLHCLILRAETIHIHHHINLNECQAVSSTELVAYVCSVVSLYKWVYLSAKLWRKGQTENKCLITVGMSVNDFVANTHCRRTKRAQIHVDTRAALLVEWPMNWDWIHRSFYAGIICLSTILNWTWCSHSINTEKKNKRQNDTRNEYLMQKLCLSTLIGHRLASVRRSSDSNWRIDDACIWYLIVRTRSDRWRTIL